MPYRRRSDGGYEPIAKSASEVLEQLDKDGIKFVALQFTGLSGKFHEVLVPRRIIEEEMINEGLARLDGSSIKGFAEIQDSDLVLKPDPNTYAVVPWSSGSSKTARLICDVYWGFGRGRLERDPRYIAQRAEEHLKANGFTASYWGPEAEFFVFEKVSCDALNPYRGSSILHIV